MRALLAIFSAVAALAPAASILASDLHIPGDPDPDAMPGPARAGALCTGDQWCVNHSLAQGFVADGEWIPNLPSAGFVTTNNTIVMLDGGCSVLGETAILGLGTPSPVTRGFAWGIQGGDSWLGSWLVQGGPAPKLYLLDPGFAVLAEYEFQDSGTGLAMQISGLAMDSDRGHLWAILRNNPVGTVSRFVEFDVNVDPPVILQGPIDVPWPGGPSSISSAGLEYNGQDCTLLALRQDANNVGQTSLVIFQDLNPQGGGGVALVGDCSIANQPCTGAGTGPNRPWGVALVEGVTSMVIYSDLNVLSDCAMIEQPADFHTIGLPPFSGQCAVPVDPSTWGRIKSRYIR